MTESIAHVFNMDLPFSIVLSLSLSIWIIYTIDHLLDARKMKMDATMPRHRFHQRNRKKILLALIVAAVLGMGTLLFVPVVTLVFGMVVSFIVLIYFLMSLRLKVMLIKEVFIASVYATGIFIGPISLGVGELVPTLLLFIQIFLLALINLLILSFYEIDHDQKDGQHSWAVKFGVNSTSSHLNAIFVFMVLLQCGSLLAMSEVYMIIQGLLMAMTIILYAIFRKRTFFELNERYRTCGDMIFFIPGLIFWF